MNDDNVKNFDSFEVDYIPKEIKNSYKKKISKQIFIKYQE